MLRSVVKPAARSMALQKRDSSVLAYATGFGAINAGSLLASPVGTALGAALSYNVSVVGNQHIFYTMDLFFKDYIRDYALYQVLRNMLSFCLVLLLGQVFVEY
eukprot:TRINITY_DN8460_c0_g1_i1.p3 TRINITY_DN8460_c0_g1~~TRINITY_DN8460_c0_g1_i1.p3  ORF type:complete len:103 (+),score=42.39 TRINITY_DN8460_c0_g1_i1:57-365(+)